MSDTKQAVARDRAVIAAALFETARERDAALAQRDAAIDDAEATALRDALAAMTHERNQALAALASGAATSELVAAELLAVTRQRDALAAELYRSRSREDRVRSGKQLPGA